MTTHTEHGARGTRDNAHESTEPQRTDIRNYCTQIQKTGNKCLTQIQSRHFGLKTFTRHRHGVFGRQEKTELSTLLHGLLYALLSYHTYDALLHLLGALSALLDYIAYS